MAHAGQGWIEAARRHPSLDVVREAWALIVQAVTRGWVEIEGLSGMAMQLRAGGDVVFPGVGVWPSGSRVIVEVGDGSATVDREAFLDVLQAAAEAV